MPLYQAPPHGYFWDMIKLTSREREVMEAFATIGRQDICAKQIAYRLGITYRVLLKHKHNAMAKNGYTSWTGFISDFAQELASKNF